MTNRIPVHLVTGFLGSGKTTLVAALLRQPELRDAAIIVNELGEVPLDHHLLRRVDERTVVLANGCVCCTMRGDLAEELRDLLSRRTRGEVPLFGRVVVESSGLADPNPIAYTLLTEPVVQHHFALESVITTVDAVNGLAQLERQPESEKQAIVADRLVITKTDLADCGAAKALKRRLRMLNPTAPIVEVSFGDVEANVLLGAYEHDPRDLAPGDPKHTNDVQPFALILEKELDWTAFGIWLTMLLQSRGEDILRVKGLLNVGERGPVVLNSVQHIVHPPTHLEAWPDDDHRSRIVFITRAVHQRAIERSLRAFNSLGVRSAMQSS